MEQARALELELEKHEAEGHEEGLGDFNPKIVHFVNPKTKELFAIKHYRLHVIDGKRYFEYPKGSKNLWFENRHPAGRLEVKELPRGGKEFIAHVEQEHVEWVPPKTQDQLLAERYTEMENRNKKLEQELAAIKAELAGTAKSSKQVTTKARKA